MKKLLLLPDNQKIVNLLIADKLIFPECYGSTATNNYNTVCKRHSLLIAAFPEILQDVSTCIKDNCDVVPELIRFIESIEPDDVLYTPGRFHEANLDSRKSGLSKRKQQGSYYTPPNIIRYMIDRSFKSFVKNDPSAIPAQMKVIDPACGTASFLMEFWKFLVDKGVPDLTAINILHGVDIDPKAVEIAIYVLTLTVLSKTGYSCDPVDLKKSWQNQIRQGNSLLTLNSSSGFDIVIGNPPYVSNKSISAEDKIYFSEKFVSAAGQYDISVLFAELGLNLLNDTGILMYITSNKFLAADYGKALRQKLLLQHTILEITDVSTLKNFENTSVYPVIFAVGKKPAESKHKIEIKNIVNWDKQAEKVTVSHAFFTRHRDFILTTCLNTKILSVVDKLHTFNTGISPKLIKCGLAMTGFNSWILNNPSSNSRQGKLHPFIQSGDISSYKVIRRGWIDTGRFNSSKRVQEAFYPKLVIPGISKKLTAAIDTSGSLVGRVYYVRQTDTDYDLRYLAVLFNSILLSFYYRVMYWPVHLEGEYLRFNSTYIANLPVRQINCSGKQERAIIRDLINAGSLLVSEELNGDDKNALICQVNAKVFTLYGITINEAESVMDFEKTPVEKKSQILKLMQLYLCTEAMEIGRRKYDGGKAGRK